MKSVIRAPKDSAAAVVVREGRIPSVKIDDSTASTMKFNQLDILFCVCVAVILFELIPYVYFGSLA